MEVTREFLENSTIHGLHHVATAKVRIFRKSTAQVANVKTTLGSVYQMLKAGNRVHFELGNCYIEHIGTGRTTRIEEKHGTFEVGIWVPSAPRNANCEHANCECANRVAAQGFLGQD